jgi:ribosomal peptide maturation radical SAM protein 1
MPWALFNRPSIQLGTLKAFLESRNDELSVITSHPYLEVASILGPDMYHWISQNLWVSEALYSSMVFPEKAPTAEILAKKYARKADKKIKQSFNYKLITEKLEKQLTKWVESCDWSNYSIIGFSVCFHQLFASLAAAKAIKKKCPQANIIFGGSSCGVDAGQSLLKAFHFIDHVIEGEGETQLLALCENISGLHADKMPEGISTSPKAKLGKLQENTHINTQLSSLEYLPVPDYSDYFADQKKCFFHTPFIPVLPIEFSRGCWWNKCSFCNLNLQWCGYRFKKSAQMLHEVKTLAARHSCLDFTFVDNMLPPKEALQFFTKTGEHHSDFSFFAEIRSAKGNNSPADIFPIYRHGGLTTIQVGIEALSNSLLNKMHKGVSVIENIATMRGAQENKLILEGNLILQFPGSSEIEVKETLEALDFVFPYLPLDAASFFLGYDSPIHRDYRKYGIKAVINHANNFKLFPRSILTSINLLVLDYRGDRVHQRRIWKPVLQKVHKWQQYHKERKQDTFQKPLLYYRDGGDFLLVRQELHDGKILRHRLKGMSRQIYLFCSQIRTDAELFKKFPTIPPKKILSFLADIKKKRILFSEKNKYLALAVHFRD